MHKVTWYLSTNVGNSVLSRTSELLLEMWKSRELPAHAARQHPGDPCLSRGCRRDHWRQNNFLPGQMVVLQVVGTERGKVPGSAAPSHDLPMQIVLLSICSTNISYSSPNYCYISLSTVVPVAANPTQPSPPTVPHFQQHPQHHRLHFFHYHRHRPPYHRGGYPHGGHPHVVTHPHSLSQSMQENVHCTLPKATSPECTHKYGMSLRNTDPEVDRVSEDVLQRATPEAYETVMHRDRLPVSLCGINGGRSAASHDRDLPQSLFGEAHQLSSVWYCSECGFGPMNPSIDIACPNCGWFPGRGGGGDVPGDCSGGRGGRKEV